MPKKLNKRELTEEEQEQERIRQEEREDARNYIYEGIDAGRDPMEILDGLASFFDGDPTDLLP